MAVTNWTLRKTTYFSKYVFKWKMLLMNFCSNNIEANAKNISNFNAEKLRNTFSLARSVTWSEPIKISYSHLGAQEFTEITSANNWCSRNNLRNWFIKSLKFTTADMPRFFFERTITLSNKGRIFMSFNLQFSNQTKVPTLANLGCSLFL